MEQWVHLHEVHERAVPDSMSWRIPLLLWVEDV